MRFKEENDLEKGREVSRFLGYFISFILMNKFLILLNFMTTNNCHVKVKSPKA